MPLAFLSPLLVLSLLSATWRAMLLADRRARWHSRLLAETAERLDLRVAALSGCLGQPPRELERWTRDGVPANHQSDVRRLFASALALRSTFPAPTAHRLLELQRHGRDEVTATMRLLATRPDWASAFEEEGVHRGVLGSVMISSR